MTYTVERINNCLVLTVQTQTYANAVAIAVKTFLLAEKMNHHPVVTTTYNTVRIESTTHDAGNTLTQLDEDLIKSLINEIDSDLN